MSYGAIVPLTREQIAENYRTSKELLKKEEDGINYSAPKEAQALYNHLQKVYNDAAWDGSEILLLKGEVRITDPYNAKNVKHSQRGGARKTDQAENDEREVEEVRRVVQKTREKLGLAP